MQKPEKGEIEIVVDEMNKIQFLATERVFRTIYKIVKHQRPFVDLPVDVDLSRKTAFVVVNRAFYEDIPGEGYVFNLDLIEPSDTS